jgi:hypothetical protein
MLMFFGLVLVLLLVVCGFLAWRTADAATSLAVAGGIAINQVTIMALAFGMIILVGLILFVAVKMFKLGRMIERRRADEELDEMQRALDRVQAQKPRTIVPVLLIAPPQPPARLDSPAPRRLVRSVPRVPRAASKVAKRWFS